LHAPIELVRALQKEAGRALRLIRIESPTFSVGFRHGHSRTLWLISMVGSFYRIVSGGGNCRGGSTGHQQARTGSPPGSHAAARRWRLTLILRYKPAGAAP